MFTKAKGVSQTRVRYWNDDGSSVVFVGGNRTWRNQNPGDIGAGAWANRHGAIGAAGGFAVFPSYEIGRAAIFARLTSPDFINQTIWDAIPHYAPANANDVKWYRKLVRDVTKLDLQRKIAVLNANELERLVNAIERAEGKFKPGKILKESGKKKISAVRKNKKGTIIRYYVETYGWITKADAIGLASQGKIDAVVATSSAGNLYLRTRPDPAETNLKDMG